MPLKTTAAGAAAIIATCYLVETMDQHRIGAICLIILVLAIGIAVAIAGKKRSSSSASSRPSRR
jgi:hypothetical protein